MTKEKVISILKSNGIKEGTGSEIDYNHAKQVVFGIGWNPDYEKINHFIVEYIGV